MKNNKTNQADFFSDDQEKNLRIENEILHLKLKAELGGALMGSQQLPPDLENKFLKNILELEHAFANNRQIKIFDFLGKPACIKAGELNDTQIEIALKELCALMERKNIVLDFSEKYNPRLIYSFIIEELFQHETNDVEVPGLITHFIYEEFHPDHRSDIESRAIELIEDWIDQKINENSWELNGSLTLPGGTVLPKEAFLDKINTVFASYKEFSQLSYSFDTINFELNQQDETGVSKVTGFIGYHALLENNEIIRFEGPFEIHLAMEYNWWGISYFVLPGFTW